MPTPKTLLISGGSRGIGRATALAAAKEGWQVAITYHSDAAAAAQTVDAITAAGGKAIALQGDTASEADVIRNFKETLDEFGSLHAVVVNAGIVAVGSKLADMPLERLQKMVNTNVLGALLFAREAARHLPNYCQEDGGSIVLISSAAARLGAPFEYVDYAASKGSIDTLTLGLSKELAPQNIRVNAIRPGLIDTEIHASGGEPDRAHRLSVNVPMARPGTADEVASAIVWLCSDGASYTNGAILDVAGGR